MRSRSAASRLGMSAPDLTAGNCQTSAAILEKV